MSVVLSFLLDECGFFALSQCAGQHSAVHTSRNTHSRSCLLSQFVHVAEMTQQAVAECRHILNVTHVLEIHTIQFCMHLTDERAMGACGHTPCVP